MGKDPAHISRLITHHPLFAHSGNANVIDQFGVLGYGFHITYLNLFKFCNCQHKKANLAVL